MNENDLLEEYKTEPLYVFGHKVLALLQEQIEFADEATLSSNLKQRLIGDAKAKTLKLLYHKVVDEYHKLNENENSSI